MVKCSRVQIINQTLMSTIVLNESIPVTKRLSMSIDSVYMSIYLYCASVCRTSIHDKGNGVHELLCMLVHP